MAVVDNLQLVDDDDEEEEDEHGDEGFGILIHGIEDAIDIFFSLFVSKFCGFFFLSCVLLMFLQV